MNLPDIIQTISKKLTTYDAHAIVVGGAVRDHFLGLPIKDYDIEVYGLESIHQLEAILSQYGSVSLVGKSFGILKFTHEGNEYDFAFPRFETKVDVGHRGFDVEVDGFISYETAAKRRDFTINAMGYAIETQTFIDPFGGQEDMERKILRHIDDGSFIEDPLRLYRAVQFCARFAYTLAPATLTLCQTMVEQGMLEELPKERIDREFRKLLLQSETPSIGFELMRELGILHYFPELEALIGVEQDPIWHPEGDVWVHTMMTLDAMAGIKRGSEKEQLKFMYAILCHDFGKPCTTEFIDGRIRSRGHEEAGIEPTRSFLYRLMDEHDFIESIVPLVAHHLKPSQLHTAHSSQKAIRRLATKVPIADLVLVAKADFLGRDKEEAKSGEFPAGEWLLEQSALLGVKERALPPLLQGRDLIALGFTPSAQFKVILDTVYEAQIEGSISTKEDALALVSSTFVNC
jgi:tRNA nucleotidyltransferase (CCA-adding enzyme)